MITTAIFGLYIAITIGLLLHSQFIHRKLSSLSFEQLLLKLEPVSKEDLLENWARYGSSGTERIQRIKRNCPIMIALASYCDNWSPQCCTETVIAMRHHEMNVRQAAKRYKVAVFFRVKEHQSLSHREVCDEYCELVECLLDLYKRTHVARYPHLRTACT